MKKLIAALLLLVLAFTCFVACGDETTVTLDDAKTYLQNMLNADDGKETPRDYNVVAKVIIKDGDKDVVFNVTWTTDNDKIQVTESDKASYWKIDVPESNDTAFSYKITATIKDADGESVQISFNRKLPVYDNAGIVSDPQEDVAYKFFFYQGNKQQNLFALNTIDGGKYIATTNDPTEACDYYVEKDGDGYKFYTLIDGTKMYVEGYLHYDEGSSNASKRIKFVASTNCVWSYNAEIGYWFTELANKDGIEDKYVIGTYNSFTTVSISESKHATADSVGKTQFPAGFMTKAYAESLTPDDPTAITIPQMNGALEPVAGTVYRFGFVHGGKDNAVYYVTGELSGYYMGTTEDINAGANMYIEATDGGYYIYTSTDKGATKTYLNMVVSGTYVNGKYESTASTVYTYDATLKTFKATVNEKEYIFGTSAFNTYTTIGPVVNNGEAFYAQFVAAPDGAEDNVPSTPDTPDEPTTGALEIGKGYTISAVNGTGTLYFAGAVTEGRFSGTYDASAATVVYVEAAANASEYLLYFMVGETKNYVVIADSATGASITTDATAATAFEWNAEKATLAVAEDANNRGFGVGATATYQTFSPYDLTGSYNWGQFTAIDGSGTVTPDDGGDDNTQTPDDGGDTTLTTPEEILNAAYALNDGESINGPFTLTGVITTLDSYNNPTIVIGDFTTKPIYCYKLKDDSFVVGATITVTAQSIKNYGGTIEMMDCTLDNIVLPGAGDDNTGDDNTGDDNTNNDPTVITITQANTIAAGLNGNNKEMTTETYTITGIITSITEANYGNMMVKGEDGASILVYGVKDAEGTQYGSLTSKPGVGDTITVTGNIQNYYGTPEIANGVLVSFVAHTCDYTDATCTVPATCTLCGATEGTAPGHNYVGGTCTACGAKEPTGDEVVVTASKTIAELITELGWDGNTTKQEFSLDDNVTVKVDGGNNSGKAYEGNHIRIYATDTPAGTLTISVPDGYQLVSIKITTVEGTYAFLYVDGSTTDICNVKTEVSGNSVVLNSVKNGSNGKQVRVLAIEVEYIEL